MKTQWLQYLSYAGLLATSLVLQLFHPDGFALFCTQLPVGNYQSRDNRLDLPLNAPVVPMERVK
jgi:hypothetical protein